MPERSFPTIAIIMLVIGLVAGLGWGLGLSSIISLPKTVTKTHVIEITKTLIETFTKPQVIERVETIYSTVTETKAVTISETETIMSTTTETITKTVTQTPSTRVTTITITPPPCPYRELFNKTVSNEEGDEILVWEGNINCIGILTVVTGGCKCEGAWSIRVKNAGWDSGWIEVPCVCICNNFRVVPGKLEVWVGFCRGHICPFCIDEIHIEGILSEAAIECLCQ